MAALQLNRTLGLRLVIVFVIANVIGSGVYKKVAPMADTLHSSGWVLVAWVIAGIISLFGALSYAEVAGLLADTGGDYAYYKKSYNRFFCIPVWLVHVCRDANRCDLIAGLCICGIIEQYRPFTANA